MIDKTASDIKTSSDVREDLIHALRMDVFGPDTRPDYHDVHMGNEERLKDDVRPSSFYMMGYLTPIDGSVIGAKKDEEQSLVDLFPGEEEEANTEDSRDTDGGRDIKQSRRITPSSMGFTAFVHLDCPYIDVTARYADYIVEPPLPEAVLEGKQDPEGKEGKKPVTWHRRPKTLTRRLTHKELMQAKQQGGKRITLDDSKSPQHRGGALELHVIAFETKLPRPCAEKDWPSGLSVSLFLVNKRHTVAWGYRDVTNIFQASLTAQAAAPGFIGNEDMSGFDNADDDLRIHDLHYRDVLRFAGGRNISVSHSPPKNGYCESIWTDPLPTADVAKVAQNEDIAKFSMENLEGLCKTPEALISTLESFPAHYGQFISEQEGLATSIPEASRKETAQKLVSNQKQAMARMREGIELLKARNVAREAFEIMNRVIRHALEKQNIKNPEWRPFQLAFILQNLSGLSDPTHADRKIVDLLFFPTGGGKTEAYLGLAAYQIAFRRLNNPGWMGSGVSVIMRYTLRLLTLDQLDRAARMICAMELLRKSDDWRTEHGEFRLGNAPIEIGLWVGSGATPNKIGEKGKSDSGGRQAHTMVNRFRKNSGSAPAPIKKCPWCETEFDKNSFKVAGKRMFIYCPDMDCEFSAENGGLPVLAVDEEIYNRLPAFIIATIDKFAALPRVGAVGRFFGNVDRMHEDTNPKHLEFYGADSPGAHGHKYLTEDHDALPPPDLIIQDELHLISGPLGTISGLYEAAIDLLSSREINGKLCAPKIIASTATVRRAEAQIKALFDREETAIFPPPGVNRDSSYFAVTEPLSKTDGRRYLGISALGIGPRKVFLRSIVPLLATAQKQFTLAKPLDGDDNPADPYMTALCYFNALRELGASRRIVEDEVSSYLRNWPERRLRKDETDSPFASREIAAPEELTSRLSTDKVAKAKDRLKDSFYHKRDPKKGSPMDVAMATNMISVGLDVSRLGLMLVQNQPKSSAEYIQATSRVGRDDKRPGLVIVILNMHRARDRSHYEEFGPFHDAFYRAVEATSVTPKAARAKDRALGAVFAGLVRHLNTDWTPDHCAADFEATDVSVSKAQDFLSKRMGTSEDIDILIDKWTSLVASRDGEKMYWQTHKANDEGLMHNLLEDLKGASVKGASDFEFFKAGWSMRDVQPAVGLDIWEED